MRNVQNLIDHEVWVVGRALFRGVVKEQFSSPDYCKVFRDGRIETVPTMCIHLTVEGAIEAIEENVAYWEARLEYLRNL